MSSSLRVSSKARPCAEQLASQLEKAIVESKNPIPVNLSEEVVLNNNEKGYLINKEEIVNWRGPIPIDQYKLNDDRSPIVIKKKPTEKLKYKQEIEIRYLKPPTPPPAEIVIIQEPDRQLPPAPPLVVRTQPRPAPSPEPIVIREAPPPPPQLMPKRVVKIPGKVLPPPARKVIYEKMPETPAKPPKVIIDRWVKPNPQAPVVSYQTGDCNTCDPCKQQQQQQSYTNFTQSQTFIPSSAPTPVPTQQIATQAQGQFTYNSALQPQNILTQSSYSLYPSYQNFGSTFSPYGTINASYLQNQQGKNEFSFDKFY